MGWGCGLPEPLGICVAGHPDIHPYVPALRGATPGRCSGIPGQTVHRPRDTRAIPHRGLGAGPDRAEARIQSTFRCRGLPGHQPIHGSGIPDHV